MGADGGLTLDGKEGANPGLCRVVEQTRLHGVEIKEREGKIFTSFFLAIEYVSGNGPNHIYLDHSFI